LPASCNVAAVKQPFDFTANFMSRKGEECPRVGKETPKTDAAGNSIIDPALVKASCD
jgi:hypothetical protein